jgi:hypothetical protein
MREPQSLLAMLRSLRALATLWLIDVGPSVRICCRSTMNARRSMRRSAR